MSEKTDGSSAPYLKLLLATLLVIGLVWLAWHLRFLLLLVFGSVLLAVIIRVAARALGKWFKLPSGIAHPVVVLALLGIPLFALWRFGGQIASQAELISQALPSAMEQARALLTDAGLSDWVNRSLGEFASGSDLYNLATGALMSLGDAAVNLVVVVVAGIFLAAKPDLYRAGLLALIPPGSRAVTSTSLDEIGTALGLWLKGRMLAMLLVGVITFFGLWWIGVPSYLALSLLAGLLDFIPFVGPIIAAVPAVLLALLIGPTEALLVALLYFLIQQLEGNLVTPLIQHHAVDLPPALLIFAVLGFGYLFGIAGVILAAPLTVVLFVLVKRLYVREYLDTATPMPGAQE